MKLQRDMTVLNNTLHFGGMNTVELAKKYSTPLYVLNGDLIKETFHHLKNNFSHSHLETEILYASKAFSSMGIYQLMNELSASVDVVSGGELYTAYKSGFPMDKVYFHGNNKSMDEINMAMEYNIGCFIVDNLMELSYLASLDKDLTIMLRVNPGIEAHTHEYIQTATENSKFGISFESYDLGEAIECVQRHPKITLQGLHCHIGSQIHETESFMKSAEVMLDQIKLLEYKYNLKLTHLNLGGGFGIYYKNDLIIDDYGFLEVLLNKIHVYTEKHELSIKKVLIEPGRLLVGSAGITLYEAGFTKTTPGRKNYVFVNGGMTDNIRPALYQVQHEACIANKVEHDSKNLYTIAGKCCESGDVLIKDIMLPEVTTGDIIAVSSTGAYNYSMASHYNRLPKPAVIIIENQDARVIVEKENYDDLIRQDR